MGNVKVIVSVSTKYEIDFPEHAVESDVARQATETLICESTRNSLHNGGAKMISCNCEVIQKTDKPTIN